jgi:D-alanine-D-alanine ligase
MNPYPRVGIVFKSYEPEIGRPGESLSEESIADMARQVRDAVMSLGLLVTLIPLRKSLPHFINKIRKSSCDVLINLCEGFNGRPQWESNIAGVFEILGIAFTGNPPKTLALCQDKFRAKAVMKAAGLPTPPAQFVTSSREPLELDFPVIVKPNNEDASLGIYPESVVRAEAAYTKQIERVLHRYGQQAIVESFVDGREFNVAVMENGSVRPLPVSEIDFGGLPGGQPRIISYAAKWFEDHLLYQKTPPVCPAAIGDELRDRLQTIAVDAFRVMGCRDYARVDLRMDAAGRVFVLEVNPNPDISLKAGYARALSAAGMEYAGFWRTMIENTLKRKKANDPPHAS